MEFNFIVCRWMKKSEKEKTLGGFLDLKAAKAFAEAADFDYLAHGYCYIKTPEGNYILGANNRDNRKQWYAPSEKAYVYSAIEDQTILLKDYLSGW